MHKSPYFFRTASWLLLACWFLASCQAPAVPGTPTPPQTLPGPVLAAPATAQTQVATVPGLAEREARITTALASDPPVLALSHGLDARQLAAQSLALAHPDFVARTRSPLNGEPLRAEIFGVYPWRPSDQTQATAGCGGGTCYRVELYNYALNETTLAVADVVQKAVLEVMVLPGTQPEIPTHLAELAVDIALNSWDAATALGVATPADVVMQRTRTALKGTTCEQSRHLCVAPTIVLEDRALWLIVDLTEGRLVGLQWTHLGRAPGEWPERPTESEMSRQAIFAQYCQKTTRLTSDDWSLDYILTSSDGLQIQNATFQGRPVIDSLKLVDWHVAYSQQANFGYSDGVGCPLFSSSAVVAVGGPRTEDIMAGGQRVGRALVQDYYHALWPQPCNYRYQQRFEFYSDGRFRPVATNLGRGCGTGGTYRPILRIDLADAAGSGQVVEAWDGQAWQRWDDERWTVQSDSTPYTAAGYQLRITDQRGAGFYVEPGRGQFGDGGRGDRAFSYITVARAEEGEVDLPALGSCCSSDYRQGPDTYLLPAAESLAGQSLVLWYVPQQDNDDTPGQQYCWAELTVENGLYQPRVWPCPAGPMFVPVNP
jgi:hypothetical protein